MIGTHFIHIEITVTVSLLERAVSSLESRFATRALRGTSSYRHLLTGDILKKVIGDYVVGIVKTKQIPTSRHCWLHQSRLV
jgi:hypothetical protein